jgi:fucose 4-O-acetylase-like acetyltransferase
MWSTETLWFDAAVVLGIFAVGNIVFGHFEAHKPTWKRILVVGFTAGCTPL